MLKSCAVHYVLAGSCQCTPSGAALDLTMNVYTDPTLLDVAGPMEVLPELGVASGGRAESEVRS